MSQRTRQRALPWAIAVVAVLAGVAAGIAYASNPTNSRPGPPVAYAEVNANGTIFVDFAGPDVGLPRARNLEQENVSHPAPGVYCFQDLTFDPRGVVLSGANANGENFTLATAEIFVGRATLADCGPDATVRVRTVDIRTQALSDKAFFIWFEN